MADDGDKIRAAIEAAKVPLPDRYDGPDATLENVEVFPPDYSDDGLALRFVALKGKHWRYIAERRRWLRWDGKRWAREATLAVFDDIRSVARNVAGEMDSAHEQKKIKSAATRAAVENMSRDDRRVAAVSDQFDGADWSLNNQDGITNLTNGKLGPHDPKKYFTKITACGVGGECPRWLSFLREITDGNDELIDFLQRLCGYMLTGSTREHCLAFGHGGGSNGKSVFLATITGIMGDYATTSPVETFTEATFDRHPTELAALMGARLVTSVETEEGRAWAESRIKSLTGGDPVTARFMRQDFFTYQPKFKLIIIGNHKPRLKTVDEAMKRRLHLIPFTVTIPPEKRDQDLPEKLKQEWPGILQWMIDGCLAWQMIGLSPPDIVLAATAEYLSDEDAIAQWADECCDLNTDWATETQADAFDSWDAWRDKAGERHLSKRRFIDRLVSRPGIERTRSKRAKEVKGIRIIRGERATNE